MEAFSELFSSQSLVTYSYFSIWFTDSRLSATYYLRLTLSYIDNVRSQESLRFVELSIAEIMTRNSLIVYPRECNHKKVKGTRRGWGETRINVVGTLCVPHPSLALIPCRLKALGPDVLWAKNRLQVDYRPKDRTKHPAPFTFLTCSICSFPFLSGLIVSLR